MFDKNKAPQSNPLGKTNRIVQGTTIKGDIETKEDFRLDGILIGNYISGGRLVIGTSGEVQGDIKCKNVDVEGKYTGKLEVDELLTVKSTACIKGDVIVGRLSVESGAIFEATCSMKSKQNSTTEAIKVDKK
ncbi:polymer-forming cytoskeletal protein [Flavobacterium jejuense]|uniref:Polymer-forming cytoskeletal protein n=1 Tax=Flavobacterium jejuense TaxID=1544455 RepID=A0ABX0IR52_9FLAO|nr:polymer-forming cytoskeletal protein [Flavobacterium jejuense]NHN25696.1 polymer-forming cytoskeletal protein [Flavobacterium jejuense]